MNAKKVLELQSNYARQQGDINGWRTNTRHAR